MDIHPRPMFTRSNSIHKRFMNDEKKCQQNCQQKSSKVVRGQFATSSPALYGNLSISGPKGRGEGRRFRPSSPSYIAGLQVFRTSDRRNVSKIVSKSPDRPSTAWYCRRTLQLLTNGPDLIAVNLLP